MRNGRYVWWRSALGVVIAPALLLILTALISQLVVRLAWAISGTGADYAEYADRANAFELPSGLLAANLGIAVLAPMSWLLVVVVHRVCPRWLSSVPPGIRWRYLITLAIAVVVLVGVQLLSFLAKPVSGWGLQQSFWGFLIVILLTSPLQAVAEVALRSRVDLARGQ